MKLLFYIGVNQYGGAERVIINLCNEFVKREYEVVLLLNLKGKVGYEIDGRVKQIILEEKVDLKRNKLMLHIGYIHEMIKVMKCEKPNVIVSFLPENNIRSILVGKVVKIPTIISVRVDPKMEGNSFGKKIARRLLYNYADLVVLQNYGAKDRFGKWFKANCIVIPNFVNEIFLQCPFVEERSKKIVAVGRLSKQKNFAMLIDAFKRLREKNEIFKEYILVIYGEGEERGRLEHQIKALELEDKVFLPGNSNKIRDEICDASLFVLSSDFEGVPNVLLEAMALGIPSIATDIPNRACQEIIKDKENGLLIPVGSLDKLVEAMSYMLINKEEANKMGKNATKYMKNHYSPNVVYDCWEENIMTYINSR